MDCVITLVHGTELMAPLVSPRPTFYRSESLLQSVLRSKLPQQIHFETFRWGGGNTILARQTAALRLRRQLRRTIDASPEAQHFIIGHSHGGTISLYALRDDYVRQRVRGTICLSTPFPVGRPRDLGSYGRRHLWVLGIVVNLVVGLLLMEYAFDGAIGRWTDHLPDMLRYGAYTVVSLVLFVPIVLLGTLWEATTNWAIAALSLPAVDEDSLLIIRSTGDEASEALGSARFLSSLFTRLWLVTTAVGPFLARTTESLSARIRPIRKRVLLAIAGGIGLFVVGEVLTEAIGVPADGPWTYPLIALIMGGCLVITAPYALQALSNTSIALSAVLALPLIVLTGILCAVFGPELAAANLLLDVSAEATPPGTWRVAELERLYLASSEHPALPALRHATYEDPVACAEIARWIGGRG
jgi:pimeloyl-ACP methyl ester carboxylesterase